MRIRLRQTKTSKTERGNMEPTIGPIPMQRAEETRRKLIGAAVDEIRKRCQLADSIGEWLPRSVLFVHKVRRAVSSDGPSLSAPKRHLVLVEIKSIPNPRFGILKCRWVPVVH